MNLDELKVSECVILNVKIVHSKMKISWKLTHLQTIQNIDEFVSPSEQIWRNLALHHLLTNGSV